MSGLFPTIKKPPPPPSTPTNADASVVAAGERGFKPYQSLVSTGSASGLTTKAKTVKRSLIGGAM